MVAVRRSSLTHLLESSDLKSETKSPMQKLSADARGPPNVFERCQKPVYDLLYHDLLPPMLPRGFRDLRFGFRGTSLVEILFHGTSATYFSKVLIG